MNAADARQSMLRIRVRQKKSLPRTIQISFKLETVVVRPEWGAVPWKSAPGGHLWQACRHRQYWSGYRGMIAVDPVRTRLFRQIRIRRQAGNSTRQ